MVCRLILHLNRQLRRTCICINIRLNIEPAENTGEISFIVADPRQGQGLGSKMVDYMIEICRDKKLEKIHAIMLPDNYRAIKLFQEMGFTIELLDDGTQRAILNLKEEFENQPGPWKGAK